MRRAVKCVKGLVLGHSSAHPYKRPSPPGISVPACLCTESNASTAPFVLDRVSSPPLLVCYQNPGLIFHQPWRVLHEPAQLFDAVSVFISSAILRGRASPGIRGSVFHLSVSTFLISPPCLHASCARTTGQRRNPAEIWLVNVPVGLTPRLQAITPTPVPRTTSEL